ncbi:MAG: ABC transporter ATP-binding protein [Phycisphaerales bacterium]
MPPGSTDAVPEIVATDLRKSFGEQLVINSVNVTINAGELVAIVGASGSGKTVLLNMLTGLLWPDAGRVEVADHDALPAGDPPRLPLVRLDALDDLGLDRIRLHWSVVFQKNALFSGTVEDNVALWLKEHTRLDERSIRTRVRESLAAVALDVDETMPKDRAQLSGGMAKRVAIARAIAVDPIVIFYDEPTTGLDPVVSGQVHELIWNTHHRPREDGARRTTIVVTHDKDLLRRIQPRILMLDQGAVCVDGSYEEFAQSECEAARTYLSAMPVLHARHAQH